MWSQHPTAGIPVLDHVNAETHFLLTFFHLTDPPKRFLYILNSKKYESYTFFETKYTRSGNETTQVNNIFA